MKPEGSFLWLHCGSPRTPTLRRINSVLVLPSYLFKINFNIIFLLISRRSVGVIPSRPPPTRHNNSVYISFTLPCAKSASHLILLYYMTCLVKVQVEMLLFMQLSPLPSCFLHLGPRVLIHYDDLERTEIFIICNVFLWIGNSYG